MLSGMSEQNFNTLSSDGDSLFLPVSAVGIAKCHTLDVQNLRNVIYPKGYMAHMQNLGNAICPSN